MHRWCAFMYLSLCVHACGYVYEPLSVFGIGTCWLKALKAFQSIAKRTLISLIISLNHQHNTGQYNCNLVWTVVATVQMELAPSLAHIWDPSPCASLHVVVFKITLDAVSRGSKVFLTFHCQPFIKGGLSLLVPTCSSGVARSVFVKSPFTGKADFLGALAHY